MNALNLPRPASMTEDHVLLEERARRFIGDEFVPHVTMKLPIARSL
jgi:hypothetical protein